MSRAMLLAFKSRALEEVRADWRAPEALTSRQGYVPCGGGGGRRNRQGGSPPLLSSAAPLLSSPQAFLRRRQRQLLGQDVMWALWWSAMAVGGLFKVSVPPALRCIPVRPISPASCPLTRASCLRLQWARTPGALQLSDVPLAVIYTLSCPALLVVIFCL